LLPYHLRLALRSLRRDPGLSTTIVVVLAIAAGIFCTALMHYLRNHQTTSSAPASLHQVEIAVAREALAAAFVGSNAEPNFIASRERVSFPMLRVLAASGLPTRQTATFRARVLVGGPHEAVGRAALPPWPRNARFAQADFFPMFGLSFRYGGAWTREDDAGGAAVVVLGGPLNDQLFGGDDSVGRTIMVDDRPFRVVGVIEGDQPFAPDWDRAVTGGPQDLLYLPFAEHERLLARPEAPIAVAPEGPRYADLLASDTAAPAFWIDLPTPALREAYARHLEATLGARNKRYTLRDLPRLRRDLAFPRTVFKFFLFLTFLVLAGGGLVTTRLHLAKSVTRQGELSIFRAVGAPRSAIVARQLLEALVLSTFGGVAAVAVAGPSAFVYNHLIGDTDIPLRVTLPSFGITLAATVLVGTLAALYPAWRAAARRPTTAIMRY
jgi:putative ABC transport system permease protein